MLENMYVVHVAIHVVVHVVVHDAEHVVAHKLQSIDVKSYHLCATTRKHPNWSAENQSKPD
jgi:hypothetical protein